MSGLDYNKLKEHTKEVRSRECDSLDFKNVKTEDDFFEHLHKQEISSGKSRIRLYALSVPLNYSKTFISTVYDDFFDKAPKKLRVSHLTSFAYNLMKHQDLFFGEDDDFNKRRSKFVEGALELSVTDNLCGNNFDTAISNYAVLIGKIEGEKLELYINRVLRADELNQNFTCAFSTGLVAILQNLSLPNAQIFTSEAFELLKAEDYSTPGLSEASSYITLSSDIALNRFSELLK